MPTRPSPSPSPIRPAYQDCLLGLLGLHLAIALALTLLGLLSLPGLLALG